MYIYLFSPLGTHRVFGGFHCTISMSVACALLSVSDRSPLFSSRVSRLLDCSSARFTSYFLSGDLMSTCVHALMRGQVGWSSLVTFRFRLLLTQFTREKIPTMGEQGRCFVFPDQGMRVQSVQCSNGGWNAITAEKACQLNSSGTLEETTHFCGFVSSFECLQHMWPPSLPD